MTSSVVESKDHPHGSPREGMECLVTMEDITMENYVEYRIAVDGQWRAALVEQSVVERLLTTQFHMYRERVRTTDCQAELRRLLAKGPPVYVSDPHGLPVDQPDDCIVQLWFASDNSVRSGVLDGAVMGKERDDLWQELRKFIVESGGSDDEEADENQDT